MAHALAQKEILEGKAMFMRNDPAIGTFTSTGSSNTGCAGHKARTIALAARVPLLGHPPGASTFSEGSLKSQLIWCAEEGRGGQALCLFLEERQNSR